jgi:hypothetical protein
MARESEFAPSAYAFQIPPAAFQFEPAVPFPKMETENLGVQLLGIDVFQRTITST